MANEQLSMNSILDDEKPKPEAEPAPPAEPAAEPDAAAKEAAEEQRREDYKSRRTKARDKEAIAQGKVRDPDTGQFVSPKDAPATEAAPAAPAEPLAKGAEPAKAAAPAAPQQPEFTDREKAFLRAAQEERGKRQEYERQLAALQAGKTQPGVPQEPAKKFWDDPEGHFAKQEQKFEQAVMSTRLNTAEMIARSRHPDFDEKIAIFQDFLAKAQPPQQAALVQQWLAAPDPAEYAFSFGKNHTELQQVGNLDALKAKIEKETEARVRLKVEAELKAKAEALEKERAALPPSLSDAHAGTANRPVWSGPPSMADILK